MGRWQGALGLETRAQDQQGEAGGMLSKVDQRRLLYVNGILLLFSCHDQIPGVKYLEEGRGVLFVCF